MHKTLSNLAKPYQFVLAMTVALLTALIVNYVILLLSYGIPSEISNKDFSNYWIASKLVLNNNGIDLFKSHNEYFNHLKSVFGIDFPWHNWSYPPHFLLFIWPIGLLNYKISMIIFLLLTFLIYIIAILRYIDNINLLIVFIAVGPFIVVNIWAVQNGFLTGGLALGCLACRERRPILAGALLGMMTIKPQLGFLFPILMVAEKRWLLLAVACATTSALVIISLALFGVDTWIGYLTKTIPYQKIVAQEFGGLFLTMMPSIFGTMRLYGFGATPAIIVHLFVAIPIAFLLVVALFRLRESRSREIVLLLSIFLVTPYALNYDMGTMAVGVGLLATRRECEYSRSRQILLATAMLLPIIMMILGIFGIGIAPIVLLPLFALALSCTSFWCDLAVPPRLPFLGRTIPWFRCGTDHSAAACPSSAASSMKPPDWRDQRSA